MKLIDKDKTIDEIRRYKNKADERLKIKNRSLSEDTKDLAIQNLCGNLLHFINNLEVKEVDLEEEDTFIEKAIGWIDYNNRNGGCFFDGWEKDFKKYIKEE